MKQIIFGRWGNTLRDQRTIGAEGEGKDDEHFPSADAFPDNLIGLMSGKGFLQFDENFNFVPMIREYVSRIQTSYCCGKCITGIKGSELLLLTLDKLIRGEGEELDLDLLARMGDIFH